MKLGVCYYPEQWPEEMWADDARRMAEAGPVLRAMKLPPDAVLDADTAAAAVRTLTGTPDFLPIERVCATACPATTDACMTAFVAAFGFAVNSTVQDQPFVSLIRPADFFATPRGRTVLWRTIRYRMGQTPATAPPILRAHEIDACFADAMLSETP